MQAILFALGLMLLPVYSFESGSIQYSHIILALFAVVTLLQIHSKLSWSDSLLILLSTVVTTREAAATMADPTTASTMMAAAYMFFNTVVVIAVARLPLNDRFVQICIRWGIFLSLAVAVGGALYFGVNLTYTGAGYYRSVGSFNNPNQLAYYAICIGSLGALLLLRGLISRISYGAILAGASILVAASASRIAVVAAVPMVIFGLAIWLSTKRTSFFLWLALLAVSAAAVSLYAAGLLDQFEFLERVQRTGSGANDRLDYRGYQWVLETPMEYLFGLGQATTQARLPGDHEVHSTLLAFLITYGLVGFGLFLGLMFAWGKRMFREFGLIGLALVVFPPMIYGITHNGSRFTVFWILFGLSMSAFRSTQQRPETLPRARGPIPAGVWTDGRPPAGSPQPGNAFRARPAS